MRIRSLLLAGGFWLVATSAFPGCGGTGSSSGTCGFGAVRPCTCPDGSTSTQACNPDLLVWRACECGDDGGSAGSPSGAAGSEGSGGAAEAGASGASPGSGGEESGSGGDSASAGSGGSSACNANQYECADGQCIPLFGLCDGVQVDCDDGSDEHPAICGTGGSAGREGSGGAGTAGASGAGGDPGSGGSVGGDGGAGGAAGSTGAGGAIIIISMGGSPTSLGGATGLGGGPTGLGGSPGVGGSPLGLGGDAFGLGGDAFGLGGDAFGLGGDAFGVGGGPTGVGGDPFGVGGSPGSGGTAGADSLNAELDSISASSASLGVSLILSNDSAEQIDPTSITFRYWFSLDGYDASQYVFECLYVSTVANSCTAVDMQVVPYATSDPSADAYLEISFLAASDMLDMGEQGLLDFLLHLDDWSEFDATNDYSYSTITGQLWNTVTLYVEDQLVWGTPPG